MGKNIFISFVSFWSMYFLLGLIQGNRSSNYGFLADFFLGSAPNFIASLLLPLCFSFVRGRCNLYQVSLAMSLGLVIYEIIQLFIDDMFFDFFDIIFSVFGFLVSVVLIRILFPQEDINKVFDIN